MESQLTFQLYHYQGNTNLHEEVNELKEQKKLIATFLKKSLRSNNLALFIGSGCSTPAVPMMGKTMGEILEKNNNKDILKKVKEYTGNDDVSNFSDIEGFLNWLQNGIYFEKKNQRKNVLEKLFKKVKEEFIYSIPKYGDVKYDNSSSMHNYNGLFQAVFNSRSILNTKLSIFTTNYDLFNEYALENNNISYTTGFTSNLRHEFDINQFKYRSVDDTDRYKDKWQPVKKEANLFKLHGSINWVQNDQGKLSQSNKKDGNIVIYPTQLKHQETAQTPYSELFREFANCLQKQNTTLIVMGYGFPDEHINNIISQNLRNQDFNLIILGDLAENKLKEFYEKFQQNINLHIIGGLISTEMLKDDDGEGKKWQVKGHYFDVIVEQYLLGKTQEESGEENA
jgi:hypothetical protein